MAKDGTFKDELKQRRKGLDLTQAELAHKVACSIYTLQHIEEGTARPSRQLAELLAAKLEIPPAERATFVQRARAAGPRSAIVAPPSASVAPEPTNPYKGLRAFQEADAPDFFGRDALTQRLRERLAEETELSRFLAVVGPSGAGKSSVVRAGLISTLRQQALPGGFHPVVVDLIPGTHPFEELEAGLLRVAVNPPTSLIEQLRANERGLARAVKRVLPGDEKSELVLLIDQFEELFTMVADERVRAEFINSLFSAVADVRSRLRVVITLRADFYDRPLRYLPASELFGRRTEVVGPLAADEMEQAISGPAERHGLELERGLVAAILHDVAEQPGSLPLMEYALTELYERRDGRRLTLAAYQTIGGVSGALVRRAEGVYAELSATEQAEAQQMLLRLVTLGEGADDTRRRVLLPELLSATRNEAALRRVLNAYGRYRMLTFDRDNRAGVPTVELAHEALLRSWQQLGRWLAESRERLLVQRRLLTTAAEWQRSGQEESFLASGARLAQFADLAAQGGNDGGVALTADERAYVAASLAAQERAVASAREQLAREMALRRRSDALRLAAESNSLLRSHGDNHLIALLALRSMAIEYTPSGDAALVAASVLDYAPREIAGGTGGLESVKVSPDGRYLAAADGDSKTALLWDATTGKLLRTFSGHTDAVVRLAFSPDGTELVTGSFDTTARLWDVATGQTIRIFSGHRGWMTGIDISPDGHLIATSNLDGTARIWDRATGTELRCITITSGATDAAFSPDSKYLVTGTDDKLVGLWDVASGQRIRVFSNPTDIELALTFSPDGKYVAGGSEKNPTIMMWEAASGRLIHTLTGHESSLRCLSFSPDSRYLLSASDDYTARLWDVATGQLVHTFAGHTASVTGVAFTPDGHSIVTSSFDNTIRIWPVQLARGQLQFIGHTGSVREVSFSPDGKRVLTASGDNTARIWDAASGQESIHFGGHVRELGEAAITRELYGAASLLNGKTILTVGDNNAARLWDAATGQEVLRFGGHTALIRRAVFSPDGKRAVTASDDSTARVWDVASGQELLRFGGHTGGVRSVAFSPDGRLVATGGDDKTARLWNPLTANESSVLTGHTGTVNDVAFSPDGRSLATASADGSTRLWDAATGKEVRRFLGHTGAVSAVALSPNGTYLLTGGNTDQTVRIWSVKTGVEVRRLTTQASITDVSLSPDGKQFLTATREVTVNLWPTDYHDTMRYLCGVLTRDLTPDERARYGIADERPTC